MTRRRRRWRVNTPLGSTANALAISRMRSSASTLRGARLGRGTSALVRHPLTPSARLRCMVAVAQSLVGTSSLSDGPTGRRRPPEKVRRNRGLSWPQSRCASPGCRFLQRSAFVQRRVSRTSKESHVGGASRGGAVQEMEDCWPSGVGCLGAGAKPPCAALAEDRRGERQGKGAALIASGGDREDVPEAPGRGWVCAVDATLHKSRWHRNRGFCCCSRDESGGSPNCSWPGGARRRGGVSPVCGFCTEREKASVESRRQGPDWGSVGSREGACRGSNRRH